MIIACAILDEDGLVHQVGPVAAPGDPVGWKVRHTFSHDPFVLRSIRPGKITAGHHGPLIGVIQHCERGERQTWIVGDIAELAARSNQRGELYASIESVGDELRAIALVPATATIGVPPIKILGTASSVADSEQVDVLRLRTRDPHGAALLERAQAQVRDRRRGAPPRVVDRRTRTEHGHHRHDERPVGPLLYRPGRILSVAGRPVRYD